MLLCICWASLSLAQFKVDPQKVPVVQAKRRALIIGATDYQYLGKLTYARSDAERFRDALLQGFRFSEESVQFVDTPDSKTILGTLDTMLKDPILEKGDLFVVFFSGHGIGKSSGDYLCATNSKNSDIEVTGLPVRKMMDRLVKAGLRNVLLVVDACRAGQGNTFGLELATLARKANVSVLLGCEPGRKSYEAPQLKSGVFTYFLLKALGNPKLRTETGALWTSRIAESLSKSVYEYTKHDYGTNAQRPWVFADPTSDVLLAKFVDVARSGVGVANATKDPTITDPRKVADSLVEQLPVLVEQQDYSAVLETSKQALSLNGENYWAAYYATIAADYLGRSGEQEKFCNVLRAAPQPYFQNLGFVQSDSRAIPLADRLKAVSAYWDSSPKDEIHALIVWSKLRIFAPMGAIGLQLRKMLPNLKQGRLRSFFEGEVAVSEGQLKKALDNYQVAKSQSEERSHLSDDMLTIIQFPLFRQLRREGDLKSLIEEALKQPNPSPTLWTTSAANLREIGERDAAVELIRKQFKGKELTEEQVLVCVRTMGASVLDVLDEIDAQVTYKPYSWKLRALATIAHGAKTKDAAATAEAFEVARKYCDDDLEVIGFTFDVQEAMIEDAKKYLNVPAENFVNFYQIFRLLLFDQAHLMGTDSEKWYRLAKVALETLQGPDAMRLFRKYVKDFRASSELGSEFYVALFQLATCVEDDEVVQIATETPGLLEPDKSDVQLLNAAYEVAMGRYDLALKAFKPEQEVSTTNQVVKDAMIAIAAARNGNIPSLQKFLNQEFGEIEGHLVAEGIAALALADLGKGQESLEHLKHFLLYQPTMVGNVGLRCLLRYQTLLKSSGQSAEADQALFQVLSINQVSPAIKLSYFGNVPDLKNFVGEIKKEAKWISDEMYDEENPTHKGVANFAALGKGSVNLKIDSNGKVSGTISVLDGDSYKVDAQIDERGNLVGNAQKGKTQLHLEAKLVSNEFRQRDVYRNSPTGQILLLTNEHGIVTRWLLPEND